VFAAVVAVAAFVGYLFIPYSGGGPTGLPFLVVSSLRYSMTAVAVGAVCWAAVPWYRVVVGSLAGVGLWNVWQLRDVFPRDRPDVGFGDRHLVAILGVGIVVAVVARAVGGAWPRFSTGAIALAGVGVVAVFAGSAAAFHRYDRGGMPTALEHALLVTAGQDEPVAVLGVLDLRSILGPRLERPLVGVSRGGEVGEIPFADENQIRRLVLDDPRFPAAPAAFGPLLDEALARSNARFLVVGSLGQTVYPEGWVPDDRWCGVETLGPTTLLERCP
jgi:hypothetical protein